MKTLLEKLKQKIKPDIPDWIDASIAKRVGRFASLPSQISDSPFDNKIINKIEKEFPSYVRNVYFTIQRDLSTPMEPSTILHSMENIEYRLLVLELAKGINKRGWKVSEDGKDLVIIAHPNFQNIDQFSRNIRQAKQRTSERIEKTRLAEAFGVTWSDEDKKSIVFLVENGDAWDITGTRPMKGSMGLWWVRQLGDGISLYYTKGRENLRTQTMLVQNRFHETVHEFQKRVLTNEAFDRLFGEFSLLEGTANWWEAWLVRRKYTEDDFLTHYLAKDRFMSTFLKSDELLARTGHHSLKFSWNTIFTGMIFQRVGSLMQVKEGRAKTLSEIDDIALFDYNLIKRGLQFVSTHLGLVNELVGQEESLTGSFLEILCQKELGTPFGFEKLLAHYDNRGYEYAYDIISKQALTNKERGGLEEQRTEHLIKKSIG